MRLACLLVGSTMLTLLTHSGLVISTIAPCGCCWLGLTCFLTMLMPWTVTLLSCGCVAVILPVWPLYLPARTMTVSPFLSRILYITGPPAPGKRSWHSPYRGAHA